MFFGFLHREGTRLTETALLQIYEFDLAHDTMQLDENKTGYGRMWKLSRGVREAFAAWLSLRGYPDANALAFGDNVSALAGSEKKVAEIVRKRLDQAGLDRPALHTKGTNTRRFCTHGFRHSFTTRHLANGKTEDWVRVRTGHKSLELLTYREAATAVRDLDIGDVEPLVEVIPELKERWEGMLAVVELLRALGIRTVTPGHSPGRYVPQKSDAESGFANSASTFQYLTQCAPHDSNVRPADSKSDALSS